MQIHPPAVVRRMNLHQAHAVLRAVAEERTEQYRFLATLLGASLGT